MKGVFASVGQTYPSTNGTWSQLPYPAALWAIKAIRDICIKSKLFMAKGNFQCNREP